MTIDTFTTGSKSKKENKASSNVVNIRSAKKAQAAAQQELMDYMMWTMKYDMDPHRVYDDPIEIFRKEMKAALSVA
tara:strand:+ start:27168 stop:27395 length:228 start_codon:yes stop_codon:yes gene_type:complete